MSNNREEKLSLINISSNDMKKEKHIGKKKGQRYEKTND